MPNTSNGGKWVARVMAVLIIAASLYLTWCFARAGAQTPEPTPDIAAVLADKYPYIEGIETDKIVLSSSEDGEVAVWRIIDRRTHTVIYVYGDQMYGSGFAELGK